METQQTFYENLIDRVDDIIVELEQTEQMDDAIGLILEAAQTLRDELSTQVD